MRINLIGGPGAGKTLNLHRMMDRIKTAGITVEPVQEYAKTWVIEGRKIDPFDQPYFFNKQLHYEYRNLKNGIPHIITDSPLFTAVAHCLKYGAEELVPDLMGLSRKFDAVFPSITIYVQRGTSYAYEQEGRFQTEAEAKDFDVDILKWARELYKPTPFFIINSENTDEMFETIRRHL